MAQKKKKRAAGRRPVSRNAPWHGRRGGNPGGMIATLVALGVVAALLGNLADCTADDRRRAETEAATGSLRLNEIMSENRQTLTTEGGEAPDWIEIANVSGEPVQTGGFALLLQSNVNKIFTLPDDVLQPNECLLIYANGRGRDMDAPFKLPASGGDALVLLNPRGQVVDVVELPELACDQSYNRDAEGSWEISDKPTPGSLTRAASAAGTTGLELKEDAVSLSEAMSGNTVYLPDENGRCWDYVELHNASAQSADLTGWYLSDSIDDLKKWVFPQTVLPANGYLTVFCSGGNGAGLHANFKLSSEGERVYLSRPDGQTVSMVELPALKKNQAWSLANGSWSAELPPTPNMENTPEAAAQANAYAFGDGTGRLCLNEIMASTSDQAADWIEIYNGSAQAVDLSGYGLSDNSARPRKWQFPAGTVVQAGAYLGVYCSGTADATLEGQINADFALPSEGACTVTLSDPQGRILDAAYLPRQYGGISYGRFAGEAGFFYCETATPGTANSGAHYRGRAEAAQYSVAGGLYQSGDRFSVELSAAEGSRIYYTLDCSDPDEQSTLYTQPIPIEKTTILRTRVYRDGCMPSHMDAQSYLYDVNDGGAYVVSLVSDPDNLYSDDSGIMVMGRNAWSEYPYGKINQGANFWMDWEREAHVELFAPGNESTALSQECGIKLHGQFSRAQKVKAFKVFARGKYGESRFRYPIFSERDYGEYQSFLLRTSGQDFNMTFMRDVLMTSLARGTSLMFQESELGVCYLNGEYYSMVWLRERVSKHSICQFEGWEGMEDDIDLIKANNVEKQGSNDTFEALLSWLRENDVRTQEAYDRIDSTIDIQNYIEYMAVEIFSGNGDTLNVKRYRNARADGKWRWVLFDLDWAFSTDTNSISRWLTPGGMGTEKRTDNSLFIACMKNPIFRDQFLSYFGEQMATTFSTENLLELIDERYARMEALLPEYLKSINMGEENYRQQLEKLREYARTRPWKLLEYFDKVFKFSDEEKQRYFAAAVEKIRQG